MQEATETGMETYLYSEKKKKSEIKLQENMLMDRKDSLGIDRQNNLLGRD